MPPQQPNPFDSIMRGAPLDGTRPTPPSPNPFDDVMRKPDEEEQRRMRAAQQTTQDTTPDKRAEAIRISGQTGLPVDVVERDQANLAKQHAVENVPYGRIQQQTGGLAAWITDPNNAAIARGDLEQMGNLEWVLTAPGRAFASVINNVRYSELRAKSLTTTLTRDEQDAMESYKFNALRDQNLAEKGWFGKAVTGAGRMLGQLVEPAKYGLAGGLEVGAIGAAGGSIIPGAGTVVGGKAGFLIGARAGVVYGAFKSAALQEGVEVYDSLLSMKDEMGRPIDPGVARMAALGVGVANGMIEMVGLEAFLKNIPGLDKLAKGGMKEAVTAALRNPSVRSALGQLAKRYGGSMSAEIATEVGQRAVSLMGEELTKYASGASFDQQRRAPADWANDLIDTAVEAVPEFAFGMLPGPTLHFVQDVQRAKQGEQAVSLFNAIGEGIEQSETAKRLPPAMRDYVARVTKDGPIKTLYQSTDSFVAYWQSKGLNPSDVAAEITGKADALEEAQKSGLLAIETADYAAKIAGTEHNAYFAEELRLDPDAMNGREAREFKENIENLKKAVAAEQERQKEAAEPEAQMVKALTEQIVGQLGVPRGTALQMATLAAGVANLAERGGFDPNTFLAPYGLQFQRKTVDEFAAEQTAQGEAAAATMQGEKPAAPPTEEIPGLAELEAGLGGATIESVGAAGLTVENASGESAASQEALSRQEGMRARGEQFVVYDRAGRARPLIGPDAVDYNPKPGETYGVQSATEFRVLTDNGGRVPAQTGGAPQTPVGRQLGQMFGQAQPLPAIKSGVRFDGQWGEATPDGVRAQFIGYQTGNKWMPTHALYNIEGGEWDGSTVGVEKLEALGIPVPPTPPLLEFNQNAIAKSPAFSDWFGDSVVLDNQGDPLVVYHGTTQVFTRFNQDVANPEADFGAGFYFSNNPLDVAENYATIGPDARNKIDSRTEQIQQELDESETGGEAGDAERIARAEVVAQEGLTMPVFLKIERPAVFGGPTETQLTFETEFDEETGDIIGEAHGTLIDFAEGLRQAAGEFYEGDIEAAIARLYERGYEGISLREAVEQLRKDEGLIYATDDQGRLVSNEIIRRAIEHTGFDGIIDHTVDVKFGSQRTVGKVMAGMDEDTTHYVVFSSNQIKSAIGNRGTFDATTPDILFQGSIEPVPQQAVFYSKVVRAVEEAKQEKGTGAQWKGVIRNAKIGINQDELAIARIDELDDNAKYGKGEILAYVKQNIPRANLVLLGEPRPATPEGQELVTQEEDEDEDATPEDPDDEDLEEYESDIREEMENDAWNDLDWDDYIGSATTIEDEIEVENEVEREVQAEDENGEPLFDDDGDPVMETITETETEMQTVYYPAATSGMYRIGRGRVEHRRRTEIIPDAESYETEEEAERAAEEWLQEQRDDDYIRERVQEQIYEGLDWGDIREEAIRRWRNDNGQGGGGIRPKPALDPYRVRYSSASYQIDPLADQKTYREAILTSPPVFKSKQEIGPPLEEVSQAMFGLPPEQLNELQQEVAIAGVANNAKTEVQTYDWTDGHDAYDDIPRPIVRLRFTFRESLGPKLHAETIEPTAEERAAFEARDAVNLELEALRQKVLARTNEQRRQRGLEAYEPDTRLRMMLYDMTDEDRSEWYRLRDSVTEGNAIEERFTERKIAHDNARGPGKRIMFIEEVQPPKKNELAKMPPVFVKNWREIAFKWALRHAVDQGAEALVWVTGEQQANRWSLVNKVERIDHHKYAPVTEGSDPILKTAWERGERYTVKIKIKSGDTPILILNESGVVIRVDNDYSGTWSDRLKGEPVSEIVGDDFAEKILSEDDGVIDQKGLRLGGQGLIRLYNAEFPRIVNRFEALKKNGGKVTTLPVWAKSEYVVDPVADVSDEQFAQSNIEKQPDTTHVVATTRGKIIAQFPSYDAAHGYAAAHRYIAHDNPAVVITPELAAAVSGKPQTFLQSARYEPQSPSEIVTLNQQLDAVLQGALAAAPEGTQLSAHVNSNGEVYVSMLRIPPGERKRGVGTLVMRSVLDWADEHNLQVALTPQADPRRAAPLERFYQRLGFIRNGTSRFYDPASSGSRVRPAIKDRQRRGMVREQIAPDEKPRGAIQFQPNRQATITLFENADLSTFLHEMGHFYLELFGDLDDRLAALDPTTLNAQQVQLRADYQTVLRHLGIAHRGEITKKEHELFARSFEVYLMEGKAPTPALREAFSRIRAWMLGIYKSLKALNAPLSDDVRKVFDRMVASDAAIAEAEADARMAPMWLTPEQAKMSPERFALYRKTVEEASRAASEELERKLMAEVTRERTAQWKERRAEVKAQVERETYNLPVYKALHAMMRGKTPDGQQIGDGTALKLSKKLIVDQFGAARLKGLPKQLYSAEGGLAPNTAAELFGYASGDELLAAIAAAPPMRERITQETDKRMLLEHGAMLLDGSIHEEAKQAVAVEQRKAGLKEDLRALAKMQRAAGPHVKQALREAAAERKYERRWFEAETKARIAAANGESQAVIDGLRAEATAARALLRSAPVTIRGALPNMQDVHDAAQQSVAGTKISELNSRLYWSAARKASQAATEAAARGDYDEAIRHKHRELITLAIYREIEKAKDDIEKRVRAARDLGKPGTLAKIRLAGGTYADQIEAMLDRFDFVKASQETLARRAALWRWVKGQESVGVAVDLPEDLLDEAKRTNYQELTYEELIGVTDGLKHLAHLARFKNRLLKAEGTRSLKRKVNELLASIKLHKDARPVGRRDRTIGEERKRNIAGFAATHRKLANLLREMDGWQDGGPMVRAIMFPLNAAGAREAVMTQDATTIYHNLVEASYPKGSKRTLYQRTFVPAVGKSLSRMERVMIALNWGNEGNRDRIMRYEKWTEAQVQAVLDTLDENDAKFVQGVWDWFNSYWPEIAAKQERVTGIRPEKVEAMPLRIGSVELRGGYFPLKYDERLSASRMEMVDLDKANLAKGAAFTHAMTKRGHTEARQATLNEPVRYDFGVISEHVNQVIHDLTHHETLIDVQKILSHPELKQTILDHHGDIVLGQIRSNLRDIAYGQLPAGNAFERSLNHTRIGTTIVGLGWSVVTPLMQTLGFANSTVRLRPKWMLIGMGRAMGMGSPRKMTETVAWINEQSPMMKTRAKTQQRELEEIRNRVGVYSGKIASWMEDAMSTATLNLVSRQGVADSYFYLIAKMQQAVDVPTWLGAYEKAMAEGGSAEGSHDLAVQIADQAVLDTQGGGQMKDLAEVQRGAPLLRLFTNFYTAGNVLYNQAVEIGKVTKFNNAASVGRMLVDYATLMIIPAVASYYIHEAFRPGDDEEPDAEGIARELTSYVLGMMLGFRELTGFVQGYYGYEGPAGLRIFSATGKAIRQLQQGELDEPLLKSLNDVAGLVWQYPANAVWKFATGMMALVEGETENPAVVFTGPEKK